MKKELPNGWRITDTYTESKQADYVKRMVEEISAIPRIKPVVPNTWLGKPTEELTQQEREDFYFSMQPASTQAALLAQKTRQPEEDLDYSLRPMPNCIANPEAKSLDELTAKRSIDISEFLLIENLRRNGRNTLGQSVQGSVGPEKRSKGVEAFTYSLPANPSDSELKRFQKLTPIEAIVAQEAPKQLQDHKYSPYALTRLEKFRLWFDKKFGDWIYW